MNVTDIWAGSIDPNPQSGNTELRAFDTARTIQQRPSQIVISRRDPVTGTTVFLPPQIVRIEVIQSIRGATEQRDTWTDMARQNVIVMGYKDFLGAPDTDILRADQFLFDNLMWEVIEFIPTIPGRLMASCEATP